jgi:hypothetical protein
MKISLDEEKRGSRIRSKTLRWKCATRKTKFQKTSGRVGEGHASGLMLAWASLLPRLSGWASRTARASCRRSSSSVAETPPSQSREGGLRSETGHKRWYFSRIVLTMGSTSGLLYGCCSVVQHNTEKGRGKEVDKLIRRYTRPNNTPPGG